jgi:preprotein translocase subunit YajC
LSLARRDHYIFGLGMTGTVPSVVVVSPDGPMIALPMPASLLPTASVAVCFAQAAERPEQPPFALQYLPLLAIAAAAYLLLFRPEREKAKRQQEILAAIKKNDRVVTSSGIYGTVASVDREADRLTLKIDEASNAKLTVTLSSVTRVLREGSGGGNDEGGG